MNKVELASESEKLIEANNLNGTAAVHEKRAEYVEAERFYEEALAAYEEIYGPEHLTTAVATRNLARVLRVQGKTVEASLMEDHTTDILSRQADSAETPKMPFGGSSGFFELLGNIYTREAEVEV